MTKAEREAKARYYSALQQAGFNAAECDALRRISRTLRHWHELECGDGRVYIERDADGKPWAVLYTAPGMPRYRIRDRERGALRRLERILRAHPGIAAHVQTDPRGPALYILRPGDVPEGESVRMHYTRGVCVW